MNKKFTIGSAWIVSEGSGLDSRRVGEVREYSRKKYWEIPGVYKEFDPKREVFLFDPEKTEFFTMFKNRLSPAPIIRVVIEFRDANIPNINLESAFRSRVASWMQEKNNTLASIKFFRVRFPNKEMEVYRQGFAAPIFLFKFGAPEE